MRQAKDGGPGAAHPTDPRGRLNRQLHGVALSHHVNIDADDINLEDLAHILPALPESQRIRLIAHRLDRVARHPSCCTAGCGEGHDSATAAIISLLEKSEDDARPSAASEERRSVERDLVNLLDIAVRGTRDDALCRQALDTLKRRSGWCTGRTVEAIAKREDPRLDTALAEIIGAHNGMYEAFNQNSHHRADLHHKVHDQHLLAVHGGDPNGVPDRIVPASGSRAWQERHERVAAQRRTPPARTWTEEDCHKLALRIRTSQHDETDAELLLQQLSDAHEGEHVSVQQLSQRPSAPPVESSATGTGSRRWPVHDNILDAVETVLHDDLVDVDVAAGVWAATAAIRGTARGAPLAQMNRRSRELVWASCWRESLQRDNGARWPTWVPWPDSTTLRRAPARLLAADLPHPDPVGWLLTQIDGHTGGRDAETTELYQQTLTLCETWQGSIETLIGSLAAAAS